MYTKHAQIQQNHIVGKFPESYAITKYTLSVFNAAIGCEFLCFLKFLLASALAIKVINNNITCNLYGCEKQYGIYTGVLKRQFCVENITYNHILDCLVGFRLSCRNLSVAVPTARSRQDLFIPISKTMSDKYWRGKSQSLVGSLVSQALRCKLA